MAPFIFFIIGIVSLAVLLFRTQTVNSQNNHYLRVLTCLGSIPTDLKTEENVDKCWHIVEQADGIIAPRYDNEINSQGPQR